MLRKNPASSRAAAASAEHFELYTMLMVSAGTPSSDATGSVEDQAPATAMALWLLAKAPAAVLRKYLRRKRSTPGFRGPASSCKLTLAWL